MKAPEYESALIGLILAQIIRKEFADWWLITYSPATSHSGKSIPNLGKYAKVSERSAAFQRTLILLIPYKPFYYLVA